MKICFLTLLYVVAVPFVGSAGPSNTPSVASAKVADEVKAILSDYEFVSGPQEWHGPHMLAADDRNVIWGSALCIFRDPSSIPVGQGLQIAEDVLEGFAKRYHLSDFPAASATFGRKGAEKGEESAEAAIESIRSDDAVPEEKTIIVMTARFVSLRDNKFGIQLNYTSVFHAKAGRELHFP